LEKGVASAQSNLVRLDPNTASVAVPLAPD
jgi:hypothetical protein